MEIQLNSYRLQSEKQFYLDQAKQLKDTFNQKYPDYVYKRRPNNSRRRRKTDASIGSSDLQSTTDPIDEYSLEYPDASPVDPADVDDFKYISQDTHHSSSAEVASSSYVTSQPRGATYPPTEQSSYGLQRDVPYISSHHGRPQSDVAIGLSTQTPAHRLDSGPPFYQDFPSEVQPSYFSVPGGDEGWSSSVGDGSTRMPWSQGSHGHAHSRERRGYEQQMPSHGWPSAHQLDPGASAGPGSRPSNYSFPTLTAPFFPAQGNSQNSYSTLPSVPPTIPHPSYSSTMHSIPPQGRTGAGYDAGSYSSQPPVQATLPSSSTARIPYEHTRDALSPSQPLTNYSQAQQSHPPGTGRDGQRRY